MAKNKEKVKKANKLFDSIVQRDFDKALKMLIEDPALVECRDEDGWSPFYYAVVNYAHELMDYLIEAGTDINIQEYNEFTGTHNGHTPLMSLVRQEGSVETAKKLINTPGIDLDRQLGMSGHTALHFAYMHMQPEIVEMLIKAGASQDIQGGGMTARELAKRCEPLFEQMKRPDGSWDYSMRGKKG